MYKKLLLFLFLVTPALFLYAQDCYVLVWSDEFNTDGYPNAANWNYDLFGPGTVNNEIQTYTNSYKNVRVENGNLIIVAKKGANGWTSGRLLSKGKHSFTYGRIEFRAKLPAGSGTWPALWMLGANIDTVGWPACGEIDVMEEVGKEPARIHASLHTNSSYGNTVNTSVTIVNDFSTAFHVYAVDWTPDKMDFYVDNNLYYTFKPAVKNKDTWPFDKPAFIIMNVAMGGNWGSDPQYETDGLKNGIDPSLDSARMEVDYVRYYSKDLTPKITGSIYLNTGDTASFSIPETEGATYNWTVPSDVGIISGQHTGQIDVKWGASSGNVIADVSYSCGKEITDTLPVQLGISPSDSVYSVSNTDNIGNLRWEEVPTDGNSMTLSLTPDLKINYDITQPSNNPRLKYTFDKTTDFSYFDYIAMTIRTEPGNLPAVIRLDLIDTLGNYNQDNLFTVTQFSTDNNFHTYAGKITSTSQFDLSAIKEMIMYINYGFPGKKGPGEIWLKKVFFSTKSPVATAYPEYKSKNPSLVVYPNPATDRITIEPHRNIAGISIFDILGQRQHFQLNSGGTIDISSLHPGMYAIRITGTNHQSCSISFIKK